MTENNDTNEVAQLATEQKPHGFFFRTSDGQEATVTFGKTARTKRRRLTTAAAVLAVLGVGVGGGALHQAGVQQGREQTSASTPVTAPSPDPTVSMRTDANAFCGGRFLITVNGKRYLLAGSHERGDGHLVDVDANRYEKCAEGGPDQAHTAQNLIGWDRDTQGCVRLALVDSRKWILSSGWGLIPANGRVAGTEGYGKEASERDDGRCRPAIRFGEKNPDGTTPTDPAPPVVSPVEDTLGYRIDSRVKCPSPDSKWQHFRFVPALGACIPFAADGSGFKVRADIADVPEYGSPGAPPR